MRQIQRRKPATSRRWLELEQSRLRVQDFLILFTETAETITVHNIGPRGAIYDQGRTDMPVMTKGPQGDDIVILSREEYDQLIAAINEDAADIELLRRNIARVESGEEETFTSDEVDAFLASKTPLAFFRKKRRMSQDTLAKRAGITQSYLSEIEIGRKSGDIRTLSKLADALKVSLDNLVPEEPIEEVTQRARQKTVGLTKVADADPMKIPTNPAHKGAP